MGQRAGRAQGMRDTDDAPRAAGSARATRRAAAAARVDILPISLLHPPRDTKSVGPTPLPKARVGCAWHTVFVYRLSSPFSSPRAQDPTLACNEHLELVRADGTDAARAAERPNPLLVSPPAPFCHA